MSFYCVFELSFHFHKLFLGEDCLLMEPIPRNGTFFYLKLKCKNLPKFNAENMENYDSYSTFIFSNIKNPPQITVKPKLFKTNEHMYFYKYEDFIYIIQAFISIYLFLLFICLFIHLLIYRFEHFQHLTYFFYPNLRSW